ncbi:MAG: DUF433 domain-containing protein [Anaerolineales bacterium]|nr:DUF433 domain-containing protein [Anaerolineales bacterium]
MKNLKRITFDPNVMGGKPTIRGLRVTVGMIVGLIAAGHDNQEILKAYPYLEEADIREALAYAAWRVEEVELPLVGA